ncbi:MAG: hypothetical protein WCB49_05305 [Gammaproteobacteria bacterium]
MGARSSGNGLLSRNHQISRPGIIALIRTSLLSSFPRRRESIRKSIPTRSDRGRQLLVPRRLTHYRAACSATSVRSFLDYVLDAYRTQGIEELATSKLPDFLRIRYGGTHDAKRILGSVPEVRKAFVYVQGHLFR